MARNIRDPEREGSQSEVSPALVRLAEICVEAASKSLVILQELRKKEILVLVKELEMRKKQDEEHVAFEQIEPEEEAALDLRLMGQDYLWAISLFYFGQLCSEYLAAYLMGRLPITLFVGVTIVVWGGIEMCLGAARDFRGLAAARFFLGFAEGAVSPAFIVIASNWYRRRREHPVRVATWVSMSGISQPVTWMYIMMALCITLTTPILKFSSLVINGFGHSPFTAMLIGLPGGAISFAISFATIWDSALVPRFFPGTRVYTSMGLSLVPLLGSAMLLALPLKGAEWAIVASAWLAACCSALQVGVAVDSDLTDVQ
ncbi:putative transporter, partial [Colletotrichum shisoi]